MAVSGEGGCKDASEGGVEDGGEEYSYLRVVVGMLVKIVMMMMVVLRMVIRLNDGF